MAITAVITSNGWHLPFVQSVAWINMYGEYREGMTAEEALDAAIGGEKLCNLCQYVQSSNPTQEEENLFSQTDKSNPLMLGLFSSPPICPPLQIDHHSDYSFLMAFRWEEKETPPPKAVLV